MKKLRWFVNFEKEEKYLSEMVSNGWKLERYSIFGIYTFKKNPPQQINYRIDYRTFKNRKKHSDYIDFLDDAGWKLVSGGYHLGYHFFIPKDKSFENDALFSDEESYRQRINALVKNCLYGFLLSIIYAIVFWGSALNNSLISIFDPKTWYLTPGLWEMTGWRFLFSFLFETPFVIFRSAPPFILVLISVILGIQALRAYYEQKRGKA